MPRIALALCLMALVIATPSLADEALDLKLFDAIKARDAKQVEALIQQGANIEAKDKYGRTALNAAAPHGDLAMISVLLEHGANPNAPDNHGFTPLMWTILPGVAQDLVAHHADVNARTDHGVTALMLQGSHYAKDPSVLEDIARLLLAHGAQVNAIDDRGETALFYASTVGNLGVVRVLIDAGGDVTIHNANGVGAVDIAMFWSQGPPTPNEDQTLKNFRAIAALMRAHGAVPVPNVTFQPIGR